MISQNEDTGKNSGVPGKKGKLLNLFQQNKLFGLAVLLSFAAILYWGVIASDRYVSEAHVFIQRTDLAGGQSMDFSSVLNGFGESLRDQYQLRDHLLSMDMLQKLDEELDLRGHFSDSQYDLLSRLWSSDVPIEELFQHYLSRVSADVDSETGLIIIKTQAYTPEMAHAMAVQLVAEGESYMNRVAHELAEELVVFLEGQVATLNEKLLKSRKRVVEFQNQHDLASPQGAAESLSSIVAELESKLVELQTTLSVQQSYLVPDSPDIVETKMAIAATEKQIKKEKSKLTSVAGGTLNKILEEYQRLQMESEFTLDVYKTALTALEKGRVDAVRTLKKISILQSPVKPQYPLEPRRLYNSIVFILVSLLLVGVVQMVVTIIRDHKE